LPDLPSFPTRRSSDLPSPPVKILLRMSFLLPYYHLLMILLPELSSQPVPLLQLMFLLHHFQLQCLLWILLIQSVPPQKHLSRLLQVFLLHPWNSAQSPSAMLLPLHLSTTVPLHCLHHFQKAYPVLHSALLLNHLSVQPPEFPQPD